MTMGRILSLILVISWTIHGGSADDGPDEGEIPKPSQPEDHAQNPLARGWGDSIQWHDLENGIDLAKREKKPLMLIIHKTWCGACQSLKGKFAKAKMIAELAKNFIMVNAEDDEEPWEEEYYPDGGKYIPRVLFLSPEGEVLKDIMNPKDEFKQYPYYYSNPGPIINVMQSVLQRFGIPVPGKGKKSKESSKEQKEIKAPEETGKGKTEEKRKDEKEEKEEQKEKEKADLPRKDKDRKQSSSPAEDDSPKPPSQKPLEKEL